LTKHLGNEKEGNALGNQLHKLNYYSDTIFSLAKDNLLTHPEDRLDIQNQFAFWALPFLILSYFSLSPPTKRAKYFYKYRISINQNSIKSKGRYLFNLALL
jgi:hypothetical protein